MVKTRKPSFHVVHNIPSPYRLHLFKVMNEYLNSRGIDFHVHFMSRAHHNRPHWKIDSKEISFPHTFWYDIGPFIRRNRWYLNPGLMFFLMRHKPDFLLLGGPWISFTGALLSLLGRHGVSIAWLEGNTRTPGHIRGFSVFIKKFLLSRFQFLAVPGQEGQKYARLILSGQKALPKVVLLPNIVDENLFSAACCISKSGREKIKSQFGMNSNKKLAIWPARLAPEKGIREFLIKITPTDLIDWEILILGEGALKRQIDKLIFDKGLKNLVRVAPYVSYSQMPLLYAAADLFLLPSFADPNPLSVIEAMHAGLPILVSNRIGNYPEALKEGINGWGFDPTDKTSIRGAVKTAFATPLEKLRQMGMESKIIAANFWNSNKVVNNFLGTILS